MSSVCRVCLDSNKQLLSVENNMLHKIYEKITNTKFNSDDARPRALCCFCYQKLLKCHTFSQMAVRSEKIFSHFNDKGLEISHEYITEVNLNVKPYLSVATTWPLNHTNDDNATKGGSLVTIKDEPLSTIDMNEELTTAQDISLEIESFPEDCTKSQITFKGDISDQENGTVELLSEDIHNDQSRPDASSFTIKDEPLSCIDIKEEITTELDKLVEIGPFPEHSKIIQLTFKQECSEEVDTQGLLYIIHSEQVKLNESKLPFICNDCNKIFNIKSKLISHIRNCHSKYNGKQFRSAKKHTGTTCMTEEKVIHKPKNKFTCDVCNETLSRKSALVNHIRTHTEVKLFACYVCGIQFDRKGHLVKHMRTHTVEEPLVCYVCGRQFNRKAHLVNHMRTHTVKKPFACRACDKQFDEKYLLVCHMRTHTGENPFACNVCYKQFNRKYDLVSHMTRHR